MPQKRDGIPDFGRAHKKIEKYEKTAWQMLHYQLEWKSTFEERYRSGHNEAVLKTVCPQGRVGSNPTLSAGTTEIRSFNVAPNASHIYIGRNKLRRVILWAEVPKRLKGHPWKGCRSLTAARGFKSLLLRSRQREQIFEKKIWKKVEKSCWQTSHSMIW